MISSPPANPIFRNKASPNPVIYNLSKEVPSAWQQNVLQIEQSSHKKPARCKENP